MTDGIAGIVVGPVGAVGAIGLAQHGQVLLHLGAGAVQQGADDVAADARNAAEPVQAGAADHIQQHRFDAVLQGMGGGDTAAFPRRFGKKGIAGPAAGFLHRAVLRRCQRGGITAAHQAGQPQPLCQRADELLVPVGFRPAQAVVDMADGDLPAILRPVLRQEPQKSDRIRAAGNPDGDSVARL